MQLGEELPTVHVRQHEVEYDDVRLGGLDGLKGALPFADTDDAVDGVYRAQLVEMNQIPIVIDHQYDDAAAER